MPEGLEIDHSKPLNGTMAAYAEQVLICTGQDDWVSRIEEENSGDNLAADLKELMGKGGTYSDVILHLSSLDGSLDAFAALPQCIPHECVVPKLRPKKIRSPDNLRLYLTFL